MSQATIQRCPSCGEDLRDRPPPNACPECGFAYDESTIVWVSSLSRTRLTLTYAIIGLVVGLLIALVYPAGPSRAYRAALPLVLGLAAAVGGLALRRLTSGRISGRFVAVNERGIVVGLWADPLTIPWDDVDRIVVQRGLPKIQRYSNPALLPLEDVFDDAGEVKAFVSVAHARRRRG